MKIRGLIFFSLSAIFLCIAISFTSVTCGYSADLLLFEKEGKQGLKDESGTILIPAVYDEIGWSQGTMLPADQTIGYRVDGFWGLISLKNKRLTKAIYTRIFTGDPHHLVTGKKIKSTGASYLGVIDTNGREIIANEYQSIKFDESVIVAGRFIANRYCYGLFDNDGDKILPLEYQRIKSLGQERLAAYGVNNLSYLLKIDGRKINDEQWAEIKPFHNGKALVMRDHAWGVIDLTGRMIIPTAYKDIELSDTGVDKTDPKVSVTDFNEWLILDEHNVKVHQLELDSLGPWYTDRWLARANGHEWIIDNNMNPVTPSHYANLHRLSRDLLLFSSDGMEGIMKEDGTTILPAKFDSVYFNNDRIFALSSSFGKTLWKIFDLEGKSITPLTIGEFRKEQPNGYIPVKRNNFWGFMDHSGKIRIEMVYDSVGDFVDDKAGVKFKGQYGIIGLEDNWVVTPQEAALSPLNDRIYYSHKGKLTTIKSYTEGTIYFTSNEVAFKQGYFIERLKDNKFWKINYSGRILNSPENLQQYEEIRLPSDGFIAVKMHGRYGFIDEQDRLRIANRYDDVTDFHQGFGGFKLMGKWGFIDKQERITVQPLYDEIWPYENDVCIVKTNGKFGLLDIHGEEIVQPEYESIRRQSNDRFIIVIDGHTGLLDKTGRIIVNPRYDDLIDLQDGQVIVKKHDKYGVISRKGDTLIPLSYDMITYDPFNDYYLAMKKRQVHSIPLR